MKDNVGNYIKSAAAAVWMDVFAGRGELRELRKKTALTFSGELPLQVCNEMIARIEKVLSDESHPRVWQDAVASDSRILGFERDIPDLLDKLNIDRRISAVEAYTGRRIRSCFLMANRVVPKDHNLGSGGGWHRDSPFSHQVKYIWYLSDVAAENGPFQFVPGTNVNLIKMRSDYPLGQTRFDNVESAVVPVTGNAGTLLVCDTKCIHGGRPIESGHRYAVTLYTSPSSDAAEKIFEKSGIEYTSPMQSLI